MTAGNALVAIFERQGNAKHGIAVGKIGGAVEGIHVPAIVAALLGAGAFLAQDVMPGPALANTAHDQIFRGAVGDRDQVHIALVLDLNPPPEVLHQDAAGFAGDLGHPRDKVAVGHHGFRRPRSSAMYMIWCLKMNRLGAFSRVTRTMFRS